MACFRARADGVFLFVRLTPKSSIDGVERVEATPDGEARLRVRVRAQPDAGAANRAAETTIAGWLGIPKSAVTLTAGAASRLKTFRLDTDPERLAAALGRLTTR